MTAAREAKTRPPREPVWLRNPKPIQKTVIVLVTLAGVTDLCLVVLKGGNPLAMVGIAVAMIGAYLARRLPWPGILATGAGTIFVGAVGWVPIAEWTIVVFALFSVMLRGQRPLPLAAVAGVMVYLAEVVATRQWFAIDALAAVSAVIAGAAMGAGLVVHQRFWESLEQRAADALATRELEANRRVGEERLRIARDLHDVVGHQVAVLSMQLGVIEVSAGADATTRESLVAARSSVKTVLLETQRILDVLRAGSTDAEALRPSPGIARVGELVESFQQIGLKIVTELDPAPTALDPGVDVTIYRIVQEGLTNARRYGDGKVTLRIQARDGTMTVELENGIPLETPREDRSSGYGLIGMRERVASAGGTLDIGREENRFRVRALLAVDGSTVR